MGAREPISLLVPFSTNFSGIPPQFGRFRNSACAWGNDMLWLFITAAGIGALLGLAVLRVLAVFAASVALAVTTVVSLSLAHWSLLETIVCTFMLLAAFQYSYIIGFMSSSRWTRNTVTEYDVSTGRG